MLIFIYPCQLRVDVEIQLTVDADVEEVHLPASPSVGVTMARLSSSHPPFELLQAALLVPIHKIELSNEEEV